MGPHYASSKAAVHGFVHWLGGNVARKGITINAVAPALVAGTRMLGGIDPADGGGDGSGRQAGSTLVDFIINSKPSFDICRAVHQRPATHSRLWRSKGTQCRN